MAKQQNDMSQLLEMSLDDLADLPSFKPFVPGTYRVKADLNPKEIGEHPAIELAFTLREVVELADTNTAEADVPQVDDECSTAFMLDNEIGQGKFKEVVKVLADASGHKGLKQIKEWMKDQEFIITTSLQEDTKKGRTYLNLLKFAVA